MKNKTLIIALLALCFTLPSQAQFLKKLKKKAEQAAERTILRKTDEVVSKKTEKTIDDATTSKKNESKNKNSQDSKQKESSALEPANAALNKNTKAKKDFYKEDVVIKLHENGNLNQTQFFDAGQIAVKSAQDNMAKPSFIDSEGFIYSYKDGEYTKSSIVALQSQGMMVPTMMLEAYKLPPEPFMAQLQKQMDQGLTANPFNGIVEFAFVYKPDDFRYEDFKEVKQTLRGQTYTKFEFLNEPGYEGSYVLFDDKDRLVEIYTNKAKKEQTSFDMSFTSPEAMESLLVYNYQPVEVNLPKAREVRAQGQGLMEGVMGNIVKGGNQPKSDIDEDDYDTSDSKGMTKSIRKSLKNHKVTASDLPNEYNFEWELQTEMVTNTKKKEVMDMTFLIKEGAPYQATKISSRENKNMGNTTMLFDTNLNTMVMFMDAQGSNFLQMFPIPEPRKTTEDIDKYKITELPSKTIIGYNCKGLQFEDDRYIMKIYHTTEADITLANFLNFGGQSKMDFPDIDPKVTNQFSNGLIMEMDMVDKKKSKNNVNIIAKSLKKVKSLIATKKYQSMDFFSGANMIGN